MSHKALYVPWSKARQRRTELYQIQLCLTSKNYYALSFKRMEAGGFYSLVRVGLCKVSFGPS
jgi:hypothetical protein